MNRITMKRRRNSRPSRTRIHGGPPITVLPLTILVEILLKLPMKSIVMCKSVCKAWNGSISDSQFVKLHMAGANPCALIRSIDRLCYSRSLYFLEPGDGGGFDSGYCHCRAGDGRCQRCRFDTEVNSKLKIPLRKFQLMLPDTINFLETVSMDKDLNGTRSRHEHRYNVLNSCNGFMCLIDPRFGRRNSTRDSICICNPVTGEFTYLPQGCSHGNNDEEFTKFGFGFSPMHDRYKVIRMSTHWKPYARVVEIHTLGTDSWRSLDISAFDIPAMESPSYFNGALYWTYIGENSDHLLASFNLDGERFHFHSVPSLPRQRGSEPPLGLAVLKGRLFVYTTGYDPYIDIWELNECGASFSCTQLFSIDITEYYEVVRLFGGPKIKWFPHQLICCVDNEAVVLFGGSHAEFIHYDRTQGLRFKHPKFRGVKSKDIEVIGFTPSLVSLKDAVEPSSNMELFNVNSRCGKLNLLEEINPLFLGKA